MVEWGIIWIALMVIAIVLGDVWIRVYKIQRALEKWRTEWEKLPK